MRFLPLCAPVLYVCCTLFAGCGTNLAGGSSSETYTGVAIRFAPDSVFVKTIPGAWIAIHDSDYVGCMAGGLRLVGTASADGLISFGKTGMGGRVVTVLAPGDDSGVIVREPSGLHDDTVFTMIDSLRATGTVSGYIPQDSSLGSVEPMLALRGTDWYALGGEPVGVPYNGILLLEGVPAGNYSFYAAHVQRIDGGPVNVTSGLSVLPLDTLVQRGILSGGATVSVGF